MPPDSSISTTRRGLTLSATGIIGALAGCSQLRGTAEGSAESVVRSGNSVASDDTLATDPPTLVLRSGGDRPRMYLKGEEPTDTGPSRPQREGVFHTHTVLDSPSATDRLVMENTEDKKAVSSFVAETEFSSKTLYLETSQVPECFRLRLCHVAWSSDRVTTDYTRVLRPFDERCETDHRVYESRLIRIPAALDADAVNGYGSSVTSSGRCKRNGGGPSREASGEGSQASGSGSAAEGSE